MGEVSRYDCRRVLAIGSIVVLAAGCIGATPRDEFEAEIQSRGGGFDESLVDRVISDMEKRFGADEFAIERMTINPGDQWVYVTARDPRNPRNMDTYTYRNGALQDTSPERVSISDDLDDLTFVIQDLELDKLDEMTTEALSDYDAIDAFVESIYIDNNGGTSDDRQPRITMNLESERSTASAYFSADGTLVSLELD